MKNKIPFWLQIVAILLVGVLASGVAFGIARNIVSKKQYEALEKHTVTFAYLDGTIIETREVPHGMGTYPPELAEEGVFRGWSSGFNAVTADIEVHPVYHKIAENNLFYFDSVYVQEGKKFSLDVNVAGHVSVSSGVLTLEYDTNVLEFLESKNMEGCSVTEEAKGELRLSFAGAEPIKTETLLSQLYFYAREKDAYATEVLMKAFDMKTIVDGQEIPADCATINNKVFYLQEVG